MKLDNEHYLLKKLGPSISNICSYLGEVYCCNEHLYLYIEREAINKENS